MNLREQRAKRFSQASAALDRRKHVGERFGLLSNLGARTLPGLSLKLYRVWKQSGLKAVREKVREKLATQKRNHNYNTWVAKYDTLTETDRKAITARISKLTYQPLISIIMPVYNVDEEWLRLGIESVCRQLYPHWELCIADDRSDRPHVRKVLEEYSSKDQRIRVVFRETRGHISAASNSAIELADAEFIALLDHDDELPEHALYLVAEELNACPEADLIYSDEDKLNENRERTAPHFKPDWNPDLFYSYNCISHLGVYRTAIVKDLGGFRLGYEGSQDYDLALRVIERIPPDHIRHIPHILYHWREVTGSLALSGAEKEYAHEAARKVIRSHFQRTGINAKVAPGYRNFHRAIYPIPSPQPLVSLIIGTRDKVDLLRQIVEGVLDQTDYEALEVIIVDNQSTEPGTLDYLDRITTDPRVRVLSFDAPFNFSAMNNLGVRAAKGEIVGLLNNDLKVIAPGWLREMVSHALRPEIGAVGAKLLFSNDNIQHAGIVLGIGGIAGHAHKFLPKDNSGYISRTQVIQNFSAVTAACLVMRRDLYNKVGGLDEINLTVAFNDVDLCMRINELGYRILWTPYAELYHPESMSRGSDETSENLPRFTKEVQYMKFTWSDKLREDPCYNPNLTLEDEGFSLAVPSRATRPWRKA